MGAYVRNFDDFKSVGTHRIALYVNAENVTYFDSFGVENIQKKLKNHRKQSYNKKIYRIQAYNSIMCGYVCIEFVDFMLKIKRLLEYTNLFSPNDYEKDAKIILKYFQ